MRVTFANPPKPHDSDHDIAADFSDQIDAHGIDQFRKSLDEIDDPVRHHIAANVLRAAELRISNPLKVSPA